MRTDVTIGIFDIFIFLMVFMAIFISFFIIKNGKKYSKANIYQGLFLLSFALLALEEFLNNTGYITRMLRLSSFSQPLNFLLGPLFYLYIVITLFPDNKRGIWHHFILPLFWMFYIVFYIAQPDGVKYNSYVSLKHPDWEQIKVITTFSEDPLYVRQYCNQLTIISILSYYTASLLAIFRKLKSIHQSFFSTSNPHVVLARNTFIHSFIGILIFSILKIIWGMKSDVGMLIVTYYCLYILLISCRIMNASTYFSQPFSILDFPATKYQKSSLTEQQKDEILDKVKQEMESNLYFTNNLSSLTGLAKHIGSPAHHVSQVINERLSMNYFELLASYRIEYAQKLMQDCQGTKLTIEELAEKVGYNSKSSFNTAFKKYTYQTPSEYRKALKQNNLL